MKRFQIVIICILVYASIIFAQERIDVIHLKNGNIVKGIIIKNVPNDHVKIQLLNGTVLGYMYSEIEKFTTEVRTEQLEKKPQQKQKAGNDAHKMMLYETGKKNPTLAVLLSCMLTSAGHAYAGNWGRGLTFSLGRVLLGVYAITNGMEEEEDSDGHTTGRTTFRITPAYYMSMAGLLILGIIEMVDAAYEVKKYNRKLYDRIYSEESRLGLKVVPVKDGGKFVLSYKF